MSDHTLDALETEWSKKHELDEKEKEEEEEQANEKKQKTEEASSSSEEEDDDDYILVIVLSPQPHDIFTIGPDAHQCDQEDIETKIKCYKIPVSDLGKPGTPFAHCVTAQNVRDDFYRIGDGKDGYRFFDTLNTTQSVFHLSRERARYQVVFI